MLADYRIVEREYLLAISRALTAELELADVLRIILQAGVEMVSGRAGIIALTNPSSETLHVAAVYGIPSTKIEHFAPLLQSLPYREGEEQTAFGELNEQMRQVAIAADMGLAQVLPLPMVTGKTMVGLIYVFQTAKLRFRPDAARLLRSFADQAAIAVKNARLYEAVNSEKQRLDAILEQSADGVMILNAQFEITVFNKALSQMTGLTAAEAIGKQHDEVIQWDKLQSTIDLAQAVTNGWPLRNVAPLYVEGKLARPGNIPISLGITYAPLLSDDGQMTDIIANIRDLTRYREEQALQKTFISIVSHELKTPVSIIKGYAGTLRRSDANWPPEVQDEYLSIIEEEADSLTELIDNLLETSRLQAGTFKLEWGEVWLSQMAQAAIRRFSNQTDNHTFTLDFSHHFPFVYGDERRLTQVLNNLLSNAIKYSPDGGEIIISGREHNNHITLAVTDQGIGIPIHQQHRIFHKFSRLDNALSRATEGTGLGLFLTKAIIEAHQGRIWFQNNPHTPGTTFTFSLPITHEPAT